MVTCLIIGAHCHMPCLRVGSKITQVFPIGVKETRCCGILSAKCPVFKGLLRTAYAKLFLYDPLLSFPWLSNGNLQFIHIFRCRCWNAKSLCTHCHQWCSVSKSKPNEKRAFALFWPFYTQSKMHVKPLVSHYFENWNL